MNKSLNVYVWEKQSKEPNKSLKFSVSYEKDTTYKILWSQSIAKSNCYQTESNQTKIVIWVGTVHYLWKIQYDTADF